MLLLWQFFVSAVLDEELGEITAEIVGTYLF